MNANTTATATPALGAPVMVTIDPRRAARPGVVTSGAISPHEVKPGNVRVLYKVKSGEERVANVAVGRVAVVTGEDGIAILMQFGCPREEAVTALRQAGLAEETSVDEAEEAHTRAECEDLDGCTVEHLADAPAAKKTRKARAPKKAALPEGYVTVTELARAIQAAGLHDGGRTGGELRPSVVNRRIQDARGTEHAFPGTEEHGRLAVKLQEGLDWWAAKNARVAARKAAAAERRAAKAG